MSSSPFPSYSLKLKDVIKCESLIDNKGNIVSIDTLKNKVVGLYFSAHWCGPCKTFTPQLISFYEEMKKQNKEFEIIFCSLDGDEDMFINYFNKMPWLSLVWVDGQGASMASTCEVKQMPSLLIFSKNDGNLISKTGVSDIKKFCGAQAAKSHKPEDFKQIANTLSLTWGY